MDDSYNFNQKLNPIGIETLYKMRWRDLWRAFRQEHISFQMICCYLFIEYVRPQSIIPSLDVLPWGKLFVAASLIGLLSHTTRVLRHSINLYLLMFSAVVLLSSFLAFSRETSFEHLADYYTWVVVYFLVVNIVNTRTRLYLFLLIFLVASFKVSLGCATRWTLRGFSFTDWGLKGPPGFFENSGELAIQMAVFWPIALVFAKHLRPHIERWKYIAFLLMPITAGMTILGSSSRGGQIAFFVQIFIRQWRSLLRLRVLALLAVMTIAAFFLLPEEQITRFKEMGDDKTSQQRLLYWKRGMDMLADHPGLGIGFFNFPLAFRTLYPQDMLYEFSQLPHNIFIQVGSELGYSGLLSYTGIIVLAFRSTRRTARLRNAVKQSDHLFIDLCGALNISFIGFLLAGQFVSVVYYPFMWIHIALVVSLENVLSAPRSFSVDSYST
jgi:putative inorganic carbon (HCO3(-)) transporter